MDRDTDIGGSRSRFPTTRRTAIAAMRAGDETERARALDSLLAAYWKPVYKYLRWKWGESNEDAGVVMPKMAVPGVGWLAYARDTEGNVFGMMESDTQASG